MILILESMDIMILREGTTKVPFLVSRPLRGKTWPLKKKLFLKLKKKSLKKGATKLEGVSP